MGPTNPPFLRATTLLLLLLTAGSALARTDIAGCVSTQVGTVLWYVPDTGEICEFVDCGGGRAPAKTTVPGCPLYEGTETVTPRFWTGFTTATPTTTTSVGAEVVTTGGAGPVSTGVGEGVTGTEGPAVTTMSTVAAAVSTGANGDGSLGSGSGSASSSVSSSTTSTGGAVPTAAAMRMLGAVAGVAAAGLVLA
ncbi:hypothetical protein BT67DRAFT_442639 [Trichocladium antarcticum]|uniref:Siderophore biosynthesis enzyme n=1 Tax=Trichocladium antarcticum TaxID=1450529 RepID=A0AAN6UIZ2_9PEZI|nr:hypothetical protein BT67DRAFT_442639 [Trichocladium antarcticum]